LDDRLPLIQATTLPTWTNVSAANFGATIYPSVVGPIPQPKNPQPKGLTSEMIVAGFGADLAAGTSVAQQTLPTALAGRKVLVKDSAGVEKAAKLFFVSPLQINYVVPEGLAEGPAQVRLLDESDNQIKVGLIEIKKIFPGVFTANADGTGVPTSVLHRVRLGISHTLEPVAQFDEAQQKYVPLPIGFGPEDELLIMELFGPGWRAAGVESAPTIEAVGNGFSIPCSIDYIGKQPTYDGLDQINVRFPRELMGKGEVDLLLTINGLQANKVRLIFK
jgi:uncharacterized protein (TIGR03437 family)